MLGVLLKSKSEKSLTFHKQEKETKNVPLETLASFSGRRDNKEQQNFVSRMSDTNSDGFDSDEQIIEVEVKISPSDGDKKRILDYLSSEDEYRYPYPYFFGIESKIAKTILTFWLVFNLILMIVFFFHTSILMIVLDFGIFIFNKVYSSGSPPPPGEWAHVSDQGKFAICTAHAIGKAVVDGFMAGINVLKLSDDITNCQEMDFKQEEVIKKLVGDDKKRRWPKEFHDKRLETCYDEKSKKNYDIIVKVVEVLGDFKKNYIPAYRYVMCYRKKKRDPQTLHCVYVSEVRLEKERVVGMNSYGEEDEEPYIKINREGNKFYQMICVAEESEKPIRKIAQTTPMEQGSDDEMPFIDDEDIETASDSDATMLIDAAKEDMVNAAEPHETTSEAAEEDMDVDVDNNESSKDGKSMLQSAWNWGKNKLEGFRSGPVKKDKKRKIKPY